MAVTMSWIFWVSAVDVLLGVMTRQHSARRASDVATQVESA